MRANFCGMIAILSLLLIGCSFEQPTCNRDDFEVYVAEIRESGMSERAQGDLGQIAGIIVGHASLSFFKDEQSGGYWPSYQSHACPLPGLSPEELNQFRDNLADERAPAMEVLKSLADLDSSGFVSTAEGGEVRKLFEFGRKLAAIIAAEESDPEAIAACVYLPPEELHARVESYSELAMRAAEASLGGFRSLTLESLKLE